MKEIDMFVEEYIDVVLLVETILIITGITLHEIYNRYFKKKYR